MKVLLRSFYSNGHILEFHPQTQKLERPNKQYNRNVLLNTILIWMITVQNLIHRLKS